MKLGIMQPYLFPYIGYFDLINRSDSWVVFDVVKYIPKSWMNRNRVLHPNDGWQYVSVPVDKHSAGGLINEVLVINKAAAHQRIRGQLNHYRKGRAPFFRAAIELVDRCFEEVNSNKLCDLNVKSLELTCAYLDMPFDPITLSTSKIELPVIVHPGQWALEIATVLGAQEYINPPNGRGLFDEEDFKERNIRLTFTELAEFRYSTKNYAFVEHLSILDVIMWNEPEFIKAQMDGRIGINRLV